MNHRFLTLTISLLCLGSGSCASSPAEAGSSRAASDPAPAEQAAVPASPAEAAVHEKSRPISLSARYAKIGFELFEEDDRLWVFRTGSEELAQFQAQGELAKHVTRPGAGPGGLTLRAPDNETILAYVASKPGFVTILEGERVWVFRVGSKELSEYRRKGELALQVIRPGAGPLGMTVKAPDLETADAYLYAKPGFVVIPEDGRLWVFREGSPALKEFGRFGELGKHVTRPGSGPDGKTLRSSDAEVILEYTAACTGFETFIRDGRIWVFRVGDPGSVELQLVGEPAKHVIRPAAGPLSMTVKGPDRETIDAYLVSVGS